MKVLVDIGGSGTRVAACKGDAVGTVRQYGDIHSMKALTDAIRKAGEGGMITGIALSVPGFVNAEKGRVRMSRVAPYLEGDLTGKLREAFPLTKVRVVNDGEAHARALLCTQKPTKLGAINLALGTAVAFGVLDHNGKPVYAMNGENWDIGDFDLKTRAEDPHIWWALGKNGREQLDRDRGREAYLQYGWRLGTLLTQLATIFRPCTIGLSGGVIRYHSAEIKKALSDTFAAPAAMSLPEIVWFTDEKSVMQGLNTLL